MPPKRRQPDFKGNKKNRPETGKAWHRWKDEPPKAYEAFQIYMQLPLSERTIRRAGEVFYGRKIGSNCNVFAWARGFDFQNHHTKKKKCKQTRPHWDERVAEYLIWLQEERDRRVLEMEARELDDYMQRAIAQHKEMLAIAQQLTGLVNDALTAAYCAGRGIPLEDIPKFVKAATGATYSAMDGLSEAYGIREVQDRLAEIIE